MHSRDCRGVTLVELMIATAILSSVVLGSLGAFSYITKSIRYSRQKTIAVNIAQERMEVLKNYSYFQLMVTTNSVTDGNYSPAVVYDGSTYAPETISLWGNPPFRRVVYVAYADMSGTSISTVSYNSNDTGIKQVSVYVLWQDGATYKKVELKNLFSNPAAAALDSQFKGKVTISGSAAVLPGALVKVVGNPNWKGTADSLGDYSFQVSRGTYSLVCSSAGYFTRSVNNLVASRGAVTNQDFSMLKIGSGTVTGQVWISTSLLISQVVAATDTVMGDGTPREVEYFELFNPTTYPINIGVTGGPKIIRMNHYDEDPGQSKSDTDFSFTHVSTYVRPGSYYLVANATSFCVLGQQRIADAYYGHPATANYIRNDRATAIELERVSDGFLLDTVGWDDNNNTGPRKEGVSFSLAATDGLDLDMQIVRLTHPGTVSSTLGNAYDTNNNSVNFSSYSPIAVAPKNTTIIQVPVSGTPAHGAFVFASDGLSTPVQAQAVNSGTNSEYAQFTLTGVATGTVNVTLLQGSYMLAVSTVEVTQSATTQIPNATTDPPWPVAGYYSSLLSSVTAGGYVRGYVYGSGADYSTPLSGILVECNGATARTTSAGYYMINSAAGTVVVNANFNSDNSNYATDAAVGTVTEGSLTFITGSPYFHLGQAGQIMGYVTSGTGALPNVVVKAVRGVATFEGASDNTGHFYIAASTSATGYDVSPELDPSQSYTTDPDPLTATLTAPGSNIFVGTITVSGGLGTITGSVEDQGDAITTGVLIIASTGTITDPPPSIYGSSAPALGNPYYAASSVADGKYSLDARGGTYNMRAYYPVVNINTGAVSYNSKTKTGVVVTAGQTTPLQDFTGSWP